MVAIDLQVVISTLDWREDGVLEELWAQSEAGAFTDITFSCGPDSELVRAHRAIILDRSGLLVRLLGAETKANIMLPDVPAAAMTTLMRLLYTGEARIYSNAHLKAVVAACKLLDLDVPSYVFASVLADKSPREIKAFNESEDFEEPPPQPMEDIPEEEDNGLQDEDGLFRCPNCDQAFPDMADFEDHMMNNACGFEEVARESMSTEEAAEEEEEEEEVAEPEVVLKEDGEESNVGLDTETPMHPNLKRKLNGDCLVPKNIKKHHLAVGGSDVPSGTMEEGSEENQMPNGGNTGEASSKTQELCPQSLQVPKIMQLTSKPGPKSKSASPASIEYKAGSSPSTSPTKRVDDVTCPVCKKDMGRVKAREHLVSHQNSRLREVIFKAMPDVDRNKLSGNSEVTCPLCNTYVGPLQRVARHAGLAHNKLTEVATQEEIEWIKSIKVKS